MTRARVAALALLAACSGKDPGQAGPRPVPVRAVAALEKDVPVEVRAVGRIASAQSVAIRAQVSGTLVALRFTEGQTVRQGDVLVEIDRRPHEAAHAEAVARLAQDQVRARNARDDAARYEQLVGKDYVTRQQYEQAKATAAALDAQVAADQAAVQRAVLNVEYCTIRAPVSGRTGRRRVDPGNLVAAGGPDPLVTLEQVRPVYAEFALPERYLGALRARRDPPVVRIRPAGGGPERIGALTFIDNAVDPTTGSLLLKARYANDDEALWPGQSVEVRVQIAERARAVVVPAAAIAAGQDGEYAWVVGADRKAALRPVVSEQAGDAEAVVGKGIAPGELVVVEGQLKLRPGAPVELLGEERAEAKAAAR
jgi:multidrug efflux system membrane fusion protein